MEPIPYEELSFFDGGITSRTALANRFRTHGFALVLLPSPQSPAKQLTASISHAQYVVRQHMQTVHAVACKSAPGKLMFQHPDPSNLNDLLHQHLLRRASDAVYEQLEDLGRTVIKHIVPSLVPCLDPKPLAAGIAPSSLLRANLYAADATQGGCPALREHVERGLLVIIACAQEYGLQVHTPDSRWVDVGLGPGVVAVLPGYTLQLATRTQAAPIIATPHRVALLPQHAGAPAAAQQRFSLTFVLNTRPTADVRDGAGRALTPADIAAMFRIAHAPSLQVHGVMENLLSPEARPAAAALEAGAGRAVSGAAEAAAPGQEGAATRAAQEGEDLVGASGSQQHNHHHQQQQQQQQQRQEQVRVRSRQEQPDRQGLLGTAAADMGGAAVPRPTGVPVPCRLDVALQVRDTELRQPLLQGVGTSHNPQPHQLRSTHAGQSQPGRERGRMDASTVTDSQAAATPTAAAAAGLAEAGQQQQQQPGTAPAPCDGGGGGGVRGAGTRVNPSLRELLSLGSQRPSLAEAARGAEGRAGGKRSAEDAGLGRGGRSAMRTPASAPESAPREGGARVRRREGPHARVLYSSPSSDPQWRALMPPPPPRQQERVRGQQGGGGPTQRCGVEEGGGGGESPVKLEDPGGLAGRLRARPSSAPPPAPIHARGRSPPISPPRTRAATKAGTVRPSQPVKPAPAVQGVPHQGPKGDTVPGTMAVRLRHARGRGGSEDAHAGASRVIRRGAKPEVEVQGGLGKTSCGDVGADAGVEVLGAEGGSSSALQHGRVWLQVGEGGEFPSLFVSASLASKMCEVMAVYEARHLPQPGKKYEYSVSRRRVQAGDTLREAGLCNGRVVRVCSTRASASPVKRDPG